MANMQGLGLNPNVKEAGSTPEYGWKVAVMVEEEVQINKAQNGKNHYQKWQFLEPKEDKGFEFRQWVVLTNSNQQAADIGCGVIKKLCTLFNQPYPPDHSERFCGRQIRILWGQRKNSKTGEMEDCIKRYEPMSFTPPLLMKPASPKSNIQKPAAVSGVKPWDESETETEVKPSRRLWYHQNTGTYFETFGSIESITTPHPIISYLDVTDNTEHEAKFKEIKKEDCPF